MTESTTSASEADITIGHNRPPHFDPEEVAGYKARVADFADAAGEWLDLEKIETEEQASKLNDYITGARQLAKEIEEARKAAKQPHLDAGSAVDNAYKPLTNPLEKAVAKVKALLTAFALAKAEREEKARLEAIRKAREEHEAAEKAAREAASRNDVMGESEAEARLKEAEKAAKKAETARPTGQIASATGGGRTAALRPYYDARVIGVKQAVLWAIETHPADVMDLLTRLANAEKRHDKTVEIPGIVFDVRKEIA